MEQSVENQFDEIALDEKPLVEVEDNNQLGANDEDEVVIQIGDEESPALQHKDEEAPEWVKDLRRKNREQAKRIRELELKDIAPAKNTPALRAKPTLESSDFDTEKFEQALDIWHGEKYVHDRQLEKIENEAKSQNDEFNQKVQTYNESKKTLKVANFEDLEEDTIKHLSVIQQGILIQGAKNPAILVAALGANNGKLAAELSTIKDPVKFAFAAAELETKLKVSTRKAPPPESALKSGSPSSAVTDSMLKKLMDEADKTGDRTKVIAYKRNLKNK